MSALYDALTKKYDELEKSANEPGEDGHIAYDEVYEDLNTLNKAAGILLDADEYQAFMDGK